MTVTWKGVYPAITTQFHADQSLDLAGTAKHAERMLKAGVHGVIALGTVGENCSLEYAEKLEVLRTAIRQVEPSLSGCGATHSASGSSHHPDSRREASASGTRSKTS